MQPSQTDVLRRKRRREHGLISLVRDMQPQSYIFPLVLAESAKGAIPGSAAVKPLLPSLGSKIEKSGFPLERRGCDLVDFTTYNDHFSSR